MAKRTLENADEDLLQSKRAMTSPTPVQSFTTNVNIYAPSHMVPFASLGLPLSYPGPPFMFPSHPWTWATLGPHQSFVAPQTHASPYFAAGMPVTQGAHNVEYIRDSFTCEDTVRNPMMHTQLDTNTWNMDSFTSSSLTDLSMGSLQDFPGDARNMSSSNLLISPSSDAFTSSSSDSFTPSSDTPGAFNAIFLSDHDQTSTTDLFTTTTSGSLFDASASWSHDSGTMELFYDPCFPDISECTLLSDLDQFTSSSITTTELSLSTQPLAPPTPCPPLTGSTVQWYRRFYLHDDYLVNATTIAIISRRAPTVLASLVDDSDCTPAIYAKYIVFMMTLRPTDVVNTTLSLIMHLFFYLADGPDACLWANKARLMPAPSNASHTRKRGGAGHESELFDAVRPHLPAHVDLETRSKFVAILKSWRRIGSCYAFLARRLGLGALLCARDLLHPGSMWGCAQGKDRYGASEEALRYLESVVKVPDEARKCGAEDLMRELLRNVFCKFDEFEADRGEGMDFCLW